MGRLLQTAGCHMEKHTGNSFCISDIAFYLQTECLWQCNQASLWVPLEQQHSVTWLCYILVFFRIFQPFKLFLHLLWSSGISELCYDFNYFASHRIVICTTVIWLKTYLIHVVYADFPLLVVPYLLLLTYPYFPKHTNNEIVTLKKVVMASQVFK